MYLLVRFLTGARRIQPSGVEMTPGRPRIFFANHTSHLDALVIWSVLPPETRADTRPVAARTYWRASALRRYLAVKVFRAVLVDRAPRVRGRAHPLQPLFDALDAGDSLILFPEGTRNSEEGVGEFKPGLFHLADRYPDVELVPVYLENLNRVMPKGECLPVPLICTVSLGAPLERREGEAKSDFLERARAAVQTLRSET